MLVISITSPNCTLAQPLALLAVLGVFKTFSKWFKNPLIRVRRSLGHDEKALALPPPRQILQIRLFGTRLVMEPLPMFTCLMSLSLGDSTNALGWEFGKLDRSSVVCT